MRDDEDHIEAASPRANLQRHWERHQGLVFWWATKLARRFGGERGEYVGYLTLRFIRCLDHFRHGHTRFTTYFSSLVYQDIIRHVLRYESESWSVFVSLRYGNDHDPDDTEDRVMIETYNAYEVENILYRIPPRDDDYFEEIFKLFSTREEIWQFLCRGLGPRERDFLERRYRFDHTLEEIGADHGLSKERVRQIVDKSLDHIQEHMEPLDRFADLFKTPPLELSRAEAPTCPPEVRRPVKARPVRIKSTLADKRRRREERRREELSRIHARAKAIRLAVQAEFDDSTNSVPGCNGTPLQNQ